MDTPFTYIDADCFVSTDGRVSDATLREKLDELAPAIADGGHLVAVLPLGRRGNYQRYLIILQNPPEKVTLNPPVVEDFDPTQYTPELPS